MGTEVASGEAPALVSKLADYPVWPAEEDGGFVLLRLVADAPWSDFTRLVWSEENDWQLTFHTFRQHKEVVRGKWEHDADLGYPATRRELRFRLGADSNFLHEEVHRVVRVDPGQAMECQHTSKTHAPLCGNIRVVMRYRTRALGDDRTLLELRYAIAYLAPIRINFIRGQIESGVKKGMLKNAAQLAAHLATAFPVRALDESDYTEMLAQAAAIVADRAVLGAAAKPRAEGKKALEPVGPSAGVKGAGVWGGRLRVWAVWTLVQLALFLGAGLVGALAVIAVTQYPMLRHRLGGSLDGLWALAGGAQKGPDGEPLSLAKRLAGLIVWLAAGKAAELLLSLPWKIRSRAQAASTQPLPEALAEEAPPESPTALALGPSRARLPDTPNERARARTEVGSPPKARALDRPDAAAAPPAAGPRAEGGPPANPAPAKSEPPGTERKGPRFHINLQVKVKGWTVDV